MRDAMRCHAVRQDLMCQPLLQQPAVRAVGPYCAIRTRLEDAFDVRGADLRFAEAIQPALERIY